MKTKKIHIPIFEYDLTFIEVESKKDKKRMKACLKELNTRKKMVNIILDFVEREVYDGGEAMFNHSRRLCLIILYRPSSEKQRRNLIGHEKRHVEDRILEHLSIDDVETAAFLAGYLSEKLY